MRELKFRVWITPWGSDAEPYMQYIPDLQLHIYFGNWERGGYKDAVFQQYTGLKDKNEKEIFEGDIVKFQYGATTRPLGVFAWCENRAGWVIKPFSTLSIEVMYNVEVVGNIFENPERLK